MDEVRERVRLFVPASLVRRTNVRVKRKPEKYAELEKAIVGARLPVTTQELLAMSSFYSYISFILGTVVGVYLVSQIPSSFILYVIRLIPYHELILYKIGNYIIRYYPILGVVFGLISLRLIKYIILSYPFFVSNRRKGEIELYLPHAINMMYGMAIGGSPIYEIIKTVAESRHIFGELSKEFGIIVEMVEVFKEDLLEAIRFVRDTTPSQKLSGFLDNLIFILKGGGRVSDFLKGKSQEHLEEQEVTFSSFIEFMGLISEIYLALFVLLPLFILVILVVAKLIGQEMLSMYKNILIAVLPIATIFLIWLIRSIVPAPKIKLEEYEIKYEIIKANVQDVEKESFKVKKLKRIRNKILSFILHPFREGIYTLQYRIVIFHLTLVALLVFLVAYRYFTLDIAAIFSITSFFLPLILIIEVRERMLRKAESNIPGIFAELAMLNEAGLNILESLNILSTTATELGVLSKEISAVRRELELGILVPRAFIRMSLRLKSDILSKIVPVVVKALETAPTIKDAFYTVAKYAESEVRFRGRVRSSMLLYVIIVYMSIVIFLFVSYTVIQNFLTTFAGMEISGIGGMAKINLEVVKMTFFEVTLLTSVLSGLIAGIIGEGKVLSGLKHSYILAIVTYVVYHYII